MASSEGASSSSEEEDPLLGELVPGRSPVWPPIPDKLDEACDLFHAHRGDGSRAALARMASDVEGGKEALSDLDDLQTSCMLLIADAVRSYHRTPYALHPSPCTLQPTPYALHPTPYALRSTPCTLYPKPYALHPAPCTDRPERARLRQVLRRGRWAAPQGFPPHAHAGWRGGEGRRARPDCAGEARGGQSPRSSRV